MDFSDASTSALETVAVIASKHGATVTLVHVIENTRFLYSTARGLSPISFLPVLVRNAIEKLSEIARRLREEHGLSVSHVLLSGNAAEGICQEALRDEADLVVLGSHGTSNQKELLAGSTAYFVIRSCPAPVLSIPPGYLPVGLKNILFPVRLNSNSMEKYEYIQSMVGKEKPTIHLAGIANRQDHDRYDEVQQIIGRIESRLRQEKFPCTATLYECKNMARQVLDIAEVQHPDLIVITTTIETMIWDIFNVPFPQKVANSSRFPVLSIRPRPEIEAQLRNIEKIEQQMGSQSITFS